MKEQPTKQDREKNDWPFEENLASDKCKINSGLLLQLDPEFFCIQIYGSLWRLTFFWSEVVKDEKTEESNRKPSKSILCDICVCVWWGWWGWGGGGGVSGESLNTILVYVLWVSFQIYLLSNV